MRMKNSIYEQSTAFGMGTVITHKVYGKQAGEALKAAEEESLRLERILSRFIPESDISRINSAAGIKAEEVSSETYDVLSSAVEFSKCCHGCFDVTIGPLVTLWTGVKDTSHPPSVSEINRALSLVDYTGLELNHFDNTVCLKKAGQSIDLGGIGKGYAADKILIVLKKHGILSAYSNFGGNVATIGTKPDGSPWQIGIQHPRCEDKLIGAVSVVNQSVVTSGDYQRYSIGHDGKRYHHILNPATGYPSESGLISVTLVADSSTEADALSTILFISGMEKGIQILKSFPGTEAIMIDMNASVYITRGLKDCFHSGQNVDLNIID